MQHTSHIYDTNTRTFDPRSVRALGQPVEKDPQRVAALVAEAAEALRAAELALAAAGQSLDAMKAGELARKNEAEK